MMIKRLKPTPEIKKIMAAESESASYNSSDWLKFARKTDKELLRISRRDFFKASGPGGQKKNKTTNAVRLTLSYLSVVETSSRSRAANIDRAVKKLRMAIALDITEAFDNRNNFHKFPEEALPYVNAGVIRVSPKNPAFAVFAGCLVDVFVKYGGNCRKIAAKYGTTVSQLRKFIYKHNSLIKALKELEFCLPY